MAKRYGRNQRRAHRERIAHLELLYGGWAPVYPQCFALPEYLIVSISDRIEERRDGARERSVDIDMYMTDYLETAFIDRLPISWREAAWTIKDIRVQGRHGASYVDDAPLVTIRMTTWGPGTLRKLKWRR